MIYLITEDKEITKDLPADITTASADDIINYFSDKEEVEFDTETTGLDTTGDELLSAQFGDCHHQFVVDTTTIDMMQFKELLTTKTLLLQNAKYDLKFLYRLGIFPTKVYDTFLAESVLNMGRKFVRMGLDILVERYCDATLDKEIRLLIQTEGLTPRVIQYAANDVKYLGKIKAKQIIKLTELGLLNAIALDNKFVKVLAYVEYCGFKLDGDKWEHKMKEDVVNLSNAEKALDQYVFDNNLEQFIDTS